MYIYMCFMSVRRRRGSRGAGPRGGPRRKPLIIS